MIFEYVGQPHTEKCNCGGMHKSTAESNVNMIEVTFRCNKCNHCYVNRYFKKGDK